MNNGTEKVVFFQQYLTDPYFFTHMEKESFVKPHNTVLAFILRDVIDAVYLLLSLYLMCMGAPNKCVLVETRRGCLVPRSWSYRCSCHVGADTDPRSSGRTARYHNSGVIALACRLLF